MDDPKMRHKVTTETSTDDLKEQVAMLAAQVQQLTKTAASGGGISPDALESMMVRVGQMTAEAQDRMLHPDNRRHPEISVYSYPEGDLARPRPDLKCPMSWVGFPLTTDTLKWDEIELLNQAQPGTYTFTRTDGTTDQMVIDADRDELSRVNRLHFKFPSKERRDTLPSMVGQLRTAFGIKSPEQLELERLRAEVERLKAQPV